MVWKLLGSSVQTAFQMASSLMATLTPGRKEGAPDSLKLNFHKKVKIHHF
jgi:hypothetical protein